jgi:hypothetical protein
LSQNDFLETQQSNIHNQKVLNSLLLFENNLIKIFSLFYSGLGYVVGRGLSMAFDGDWHWALRGTPVLGLLAVFLIVFVMTEPPRGEAEGHEEV